MKMRVTSEAALLYSNKVPVWILFPHDRNLADGDTQSFRNKPSSVCPTDIEVWGSVDRARRRNVRIDNTEKEVPTRAQKPVMRWTLVNVFVRALAHDYYSRMENTVHGMNKKLPVSRIDQLPGSPSAFHFPRGRGV